MNEKNKQFLIWVGIIAVIYIIALKPIVDKIQFGLGIKDSPETKDVEQEAIKPSNPFDIDYWRNNLQPKERNPRTPNMPVLWDKLNIHLRETAKIIYDAMGYIYDDEVTAKQAFGRIKTQAECSWMAFWFQYTYKANLINYLRNGKNQMPQNGLSDNDVNFIISNMKKLPKR